MERVQAEFLRHMPSFTEFMLRRVIRIMPGGVYFKSRTPDLKPMLCRFVGCKVAPVAVFMLVLVPPRARGGTRIRPALSSALRCLPRDLRCVCPLVARASHALLPGHARLRRGRGVTRGLVANFAGGHDHVGARDLRLLLGVRRVLAQMVGLATAVKSGRSRACATTRTARSTRTRARCPSEWTGARVVVCERAYA